MRLSLSLRLAALQLAGALIVLWSVGPFLWQLSTAFQPDRELMAVPPRLLPWPPTLEHFYNVFVVKQFHWYILNSLIVAGATTLLCLVIGLLAAFALARFDIRARFGTLAHVPPRNSAYSTMAASAATARCALG